MTAKIPTTVNECYVCERESSQGIFRDLPYGDYVEQVFICSECIEEESKLMEGHADEYDGMS